MKAFVFLNGGLSKPVFYREHFDKFYEDGDLIFCADGGSKVAREAGIKPNFIIGDMDSLKQELMAEKPEEAEKIKYPEDKDLSDFELILNKLKNTGVENVFVYGALGGRKDHELINVLLLTHSNLRMAFIETSCEIYNVISERSLLGMKDRVCTIFTPCGCYVEEMTGFKYSLKEFKLLPSSRGLSNVVLSDIARIKIGDGKLCIVIICEKP